MIKIEILEDLSQLHKWHWQKPTASILNSEKLMGDKAKMSALTILAQHNAGISS